MPIRYNPKKYQAFSGRVLIVSQRISVSQHICFFPGKPNERLLHKGFRGAEAIPPKESPLKTASVENHTRFTPASFLSPRRHCFQAVAKRADGLISAGSENMFCGIGKPKGQNPVLKQTQHSFPNVR